MPQLGESVTEGMIVRWLKQPGDAVEVYEPICEVATDKVTAEVPATSAGVMQEIVVNEGATVAVGKIIAKLEEKEEVVKQQQNDEQTNEQRYSPAVLALAKEHSLNLSQIKGTGAEGRVTRKDVEKCLTLQPAGAFKPTIDPDEKNRLRTEAGCVILEEGDVEVALKPPRITKADKMLLCMQEVPQAWTLTEVDVTGLVQLKDSLKENFLQNEGFPLTILPFFLKAVAKSLREYPSLNSVWKGNRLILKKKILISVAVANDEELFLPVLKDVEEKNILGLAKVLEKIKRKVYDGSYEVKDDNSGTFTINNTGAFGSIISCPVINFPQVAIITVERIVKRPVIVEGMIAIRDMVNISLAFDQRVIEDVTAGKFLQLVKEHLESYNLESTI
ncbi:MAG: hypothetical protein RLZ12_560 [Bacillota bacterium]|jgi:2-oxoisovalerate dehydrogenase E2 component (dihydrolipoyl transacylase)